MQPHMCKCSSLCVRAYACTVVTMCRVCASNNTNHTWKYFFENGIIYYDPICIEMFSPIKRNLRFTLLCSTRNIQHPQMYLCTYIQTRLIHTHTHPLAHHNTSHIKYKVSYVFVPYTQIETIFPKYFIDSVVY